MKSGTAQSSHTKPPAGGARPRAHDVGHGAAARVARAPRLRRRGHRRGAARLGRAGQPIAAVPRGQYEAGAVLNLSSWSTFLRIIVPQSFPGMLPSLSSHYLNLTKNSSLGLAVGYPEIFAIFAGTVLNQTGRSLEIIGLVMLVYLLLSILVVSMMNRINAQQAIWTGTKQY